MTTRFPLDVKPSISTSSWLSVCSRSAEKSEPRRPPTASSSSMKMMAGASLRASENSRRMRAAPSPANISTNEPPTARRIRAGLVGHRLGQQRLARPRRAVQEHALGDLGAQRGEALGVAQELDDLLQLGLGVLDAGDVLPADGLLGLRLDLLTGLVFGISLSVRQISTTMATMNRIVMTPDHSSAKFFNQSATPSLHRHRRREAPVRQLTMDRRGLGLTDRPTFATVPTLPPMGYAVVVSTVRSVAPSTLRISASAARPTSSCSAVGSRVPSTR